MRYYNVNGQEELIRALSDPTVPVATFGSFLDVRKRELEMCDVESEVEAVKQKVISTRLDVGDIYLMDEIAKKLGDTRSGLAREILEIGIEELRAGLGIRRPSMTNMTGSPDGSTVLSEVGPGSDWTDGKVLGTYTDDAMQIGGGDR